MKRCFKCYPYNFKLLTLIDNSKQLFYNIPFIQNIHKIQTTQLTKQNKLQHITLKH